jgi:hypothetical protein
VRYEKFFLIKFSLFSFFKDFRRKLAEWTLKGGIIVRDLLLLKGVVTAAPLYTIYESRTLNKFSTQDKPGPCSVLR